MVLRGDLNTGDPKCVVHCPKFDDPANGPLETITFSVTAIGEAIVRAAHSELNRVFGDEPVVDAEIRTLYVDPRLKHMFPILYPQRNSENYVSVKAKGHALIKEGIVKMVEFDRAEEAEHLMQQPTRAPAPAAPAMAALASPASPVAAQPARLSFQDRMVEAFAVAAKAAAAY